MNTQVVVEGYTTLFVPSTSLGGWAFSHRYSTRSHTVWRNPSAESKSYWIMQRLSMTEGSTVEEPGEKEISDAENDKNIWARAELPMSNDLQVQQATSAVWKVNTGAQ